MNPFSRALLSSITSLGLFLVAFDGSAKAQNPQAGQQGFEIRLSKTTAKSAAECNLAFIEGIGKWWSSDHTWSGDCKNLSIDMERRLMVESLPDGGFCNHMTLEHYQPGKLILLTGGLGPLKEMGLTGAMSIRFSEQKGQTSITVKYVVHGYAPNGLAELSTVVQEVLEMQLDRWITYTETGNPPSVRK